LRISEPGHSSLVSVAKVTKILRVRPRPSFSVT
jgi:hypothetical protein